MQNFMGALNRILKDVHQACFAYSVVRNEGAMRLGSRMIVTN
jgi:hypothetical protein